MPSQSLDPVEHEEDFFFMDSPNSLNLSGTVLLTEEHMSAPFSPLLGVVASLSCFDAFGRVTTALGPRLRVDLIPPMAGALSFPTLVWSEDDAAWVGGASLHSAPSTAAGLSLRLEWEPFIDEGVGTDQYKVCVGKLPYECAVDEQQLGDDDSVAILRLGDAPANATLYYVSLTAVDRLGLKTTRAARVLIDPSPPAIGELSITADSGTRNETIWENASTVLVTNQTTFKLELIGGAYDGDVSLPLEVELRDQAVDGGDGPGCVFLRAPPEERWVWSARCNVSGVAHFCISARAASAYRLTSDATTQVIIPPACRG